MKKVKELQTNSIGQFIMSGISGLVLTDDEASFIEESNLGGIILFAHNYESPAQLAELVNSIQVLRDEYPLFISVDHEGGRVHRFKEPFTHFPSMMSLAALNSPKNVYEVHRIMSDELKACGINLSYSPVCDTLTNPANKVIGDRSFGSDPEEVSKYVSAAIRGLQNHGVIACGKHFPGHGGTTKDSHYALPFIGQSLEEIEKDAIIPFIKASKSRVEIMMMGHLQIDAIDETLPLTLSPSAYRYLRESLKYDRIICTDDMEMKAISDRYTYAEAAVMALQAGADLLIYRSMDTAKQAYDAIKNAAKTKEIKNPLILDRLNRIVACKEKYLSSYEPIYIPDVTKFFSKAGAKTYLKELEDKIDQLNSSVPSKNSTL